MKTYNLIQESNNFMIKSGIRKYCSTICKGRCCTDGNCYARKTNNFTYCHTHISCTIFFCEDMGEIIYHINKKDWKKFSEYKKSIYKELYKILPGPDSNIFFTPYSLIDYEIIEKSFPELSKNFYRRMSQAMKIAIENKYKHHDLYKIMREKIR